MRAALLFVLLVGTPNMLVAADDEVWATLSEGRTASATVAEAWETSVAKNPDQPLVRAKLISFYEASGRDDLKLRVRRNDHLLWMVEHHPDSPFLGERSHLMMFPATDGAAAVKSVQAAWQTQISRHPEDVQILGNAAAFLKFVDRPAAERALKQAAKLEPKEPQWHAKLGQLYLWQTDTKDQQSKYSAASRALQEFEKAKSLTANEDARLNLMGELVRSSYMIERFDKTKDYAAFWMKKTPAGNWAFPIAQHYGHTALGLMALKSKDLKAAASELALSGEIVLTNESDWFSPCMDLAAALMDQGQKGAVADYLEACRIFWKSGEKELSEWNKSLADGYRPDFSGHFSF